MATVRFDRFSCQQAQDLDGTDEAFLAFFLDGEYIGNIFREMRSGQDESIAALLAADARARDLARREVAAASAPAAPRT